MADMTNYERIKSMSVEEMAEEMPCPYLNDSHGECKYGLHTQELTCKECAKQWLEREVAE